MLAPIITRDMELFAQPKHRLPATKRAGLRNVRARAHSLNEVTPQNKRAPLVQGQKAPQKGPLPKTSQSTGNLPSAAFSISPPRATSSRKVALDPIAEGVECDKAVSKETASSQKKQKSDGKRREDEPVDEKKKKENGVLKWIANTFGRKSSRDDTDEASTSGSVPLSSPAPSSARLTSSSTAPAASGCLSRPQSKKTRLKTSPTGS